MPFEVYSEFGWNVDHILPQSKGGATADYNLVCCHIKTNDEKADTFPCFSANGLAFEIIKVQNHYEIRARGKKAEKENDSDELDLFDSASGVRFFKKLKGVQNKKIKENDGRQSFSFFNLNPRGGFKNCVSTFFFPRVAKLLDFSLSLLYNYLVALCVVFCGN